MAKNVSSVHAEPPPPIVTEPTGINYATGPALGKGGFAICHRAERYDGSRPTGHLVALKIVKTKMEPAKLAQKFVTELQIHSKLAHPNIVTFYRAFSFGTSTYVVLELCPNGSLADMLKRRKYLTLPEIRRFVIQICGAVKYLHHRHIVHRDLKTGNLFLDKNMNIKVGDFGLAALLVSEKHMEATRRTTMCGTPNYLAPEILERGKGHAEKVDLWAIGVIAYTLAVGKAPFHATTKEEIYKKLKSGEYTWPELSATTNQSTDLRALVSSLLVPENERPPPDKIVSQNFFKIAFVPASIPSSARERTPSWTEVVIPSPEVIQRGYSDSWFELCRKSGVGEPVMDQPFPLNNGRKIKSIVHDMTREVQAGRQPTMPLAKDSVYISMINDWDEASASAVQTNEVRRGLQSISPNEVALARPSGNITHEAKDAELMPPPPIPLTTRTSKTGSVRRAARTLSEETAKADQPFSIPADEGQPALRVTKTRPAPVTKSSTSSSALKESNVSAASTIRSARPQQELSSDIEKPQKPPIIKRSADSSLARRPRAAKPKEILVSPDVVGPLATLDELKQVSPIRRSRKKEPEVVEILSDPESVEKGPTKLSFPAPPKMTRPLPVPRKQIGNSDTVVGSDPDTVLNRLSVFQHNLELALQKPSRSQTRITPSQEPMPELPFVSRWVDYSRKHGVGYVLSDGTVGCIINASNRHSTPVTHIFVRNGQRWLARVGRDFEHLDQLPLEVYEDRADKGIVKKIYKGLGSVKEGPLAAEAERRRVLSVLWVKFGRYMCQTLEGDEGIISTNDTNFVRFYQRIGAVGIWAFADGCLQVHFPDHTKLVISADGTHISATCISTEAAAYLSSHSELLAHHVTSREVFVDSVSALLHEGGRVRQRIVKANALSEKLGFVLEAVQQWVDNGGIGRLNEDEMDGKLYWEGLTVQDQAKKMDRVTVGRYGGDEQSKA